MTALVAGEAAVADGATVSRRTVHEDEGRMDGSYRGRRADSARLRSQQSRTALEDRARADRGVRRVLSRQTALDDGGRADGSSRMTLEDRAHEEVAGGARGSSSRGRSCPHRRCRDALVAAEAAVADGALAADGAHEEVVGGARGLSSRGRRCPLSRRSRDNACCGRGSCRERHDGVADSALTRRSRAALEDGISLTVSRRMAH